MMFLLFLQSGIAEVIYFVEKRLGSSDTAYIASHKLLSMAGVKVMYLKSTYFTKLIL